MIDIQFLNPDNQLQHQMPMEALFRIGFQSGGRILRLPLPKPSRNKAEEAMPLSAILEPLVRQKQRYRANSESTLGSYHQGTAAEFVLLGVLLRRPAWALRFLAGLLPSILRRVQTLRLCKGTATVWMNLFRYAAVGLQQISVRRLA